ncbi:MAG: 4-(cytidine 5'-diphospho)-2-C-methyl-D-erythritol kinase [Firmicutes bacterium]|nr:4-(cytidine 5'-diphospho)-2-C-methyl-D-erythritol kinase [Bacillota bacterium]
MDVVFNAPAKINLGLKVLRRRPDGYHEIETVMQQIGLHDYLIFEEIPKNRINVHTVGADIPRDDNLAYRAAIALKKRARTNRGMNITLYKNIPMGAGLGGGSADAAAVLTALNRIWNLQISWSELAAIAVELGSDVPFCLQGGTALARGRGEILEQWPSLPFFWLVLARPAGLVIHTGGVYKKLPVELPATISGYDLLRRYLEREDRENVLNWLARDCVNMLEEVAFKDNAPLARLKSFFRELGLVPLMSGSGPVMYALTASLEMAHAAVFVLEREGYEAWISWTL